MTVLEAKMNKFGESERDRVVRFIEETKNCKLVKLGKRRKFFMDDTGRHWWVLGGVPNRNGKDGWHGIPAEMMESERFKEERTLVVSVWDGPTIDVFAGPLEWLFECKESLYSVSTGNRLDYQFNCKKKHEYLDVHGRGGASIFTLPKLGSIAYQEVAMKDSEKAPGYRRPPHPTSSRRHERSAMASAHAPAIPRGAVHAIIGESEGWYVAECLEAAIVTQGRTLDELLANLRSALEMYFDDEELERCGLSSAPRLVLSYETFAFAHNA